MIKVYHFVKRSLGACGENVHLASHRPWDFDLVAEFLKEYMQGFQEHNPNFYVFDAVPHLDPLLVDGDISFFKQELNSISLRAIKYYWFKRVLYVIFVIQIL